MLGVRGSEKSLCFFMRTIVYIDGFNLYYACLKNTSYKWLDLKILSRYLLKEEYQISVIKYFTAKVNSRSSNPFAPKEQNIYLRALKAYIPELKIYYGHFSTHSKKARKAENPDEYVDILRTEEKGSDVNLAVHLLNDAWLDKYDCAVLISNDSDMAESLKLVREEHPNKKLILIPPLRSEKKPISKELRKYGQEIKRVRESVLKNSQLPETIPNTNLSKPRNW